MAVFAARIWRLRHRLPGLVTLLVVGCDDLLLQDLQTIAPPEIAIEAVPQLHAEPDRPMGVSASLVVLDMDSPGAADTARRLAATPNAPPVLGLLTLIRRDSQTSLAFAIAEAREAGVAQVLPNPIDAADLLCEALKAIHARHPSPALQALALRLESRLGY